MTEHPTPPSIDPVAVARETTDRRALSDLVEAYARGVDRRDADLIAAQFLPEGRLVIDGGQAPPTTLKGRDRIRAAMALLDRYEVTTHLLGQHSVELEGDSATGETYCMAHHLTVGDEGRFDRFLAIRYLDRFRRSGGRWSIEERHLVVDWSELRPLAPPAPMPPR